MNIEALAASSLDGVMLGFVYGIAAMGLTLIFGIMKVINLAHGPLIMLGMFAVYLLNTQLGINPYVGLLIVMVASLGVGVALYHVAVRRVIDAPELTTLLATFSVNLTIIGLATVVFTTTPRSLDVNLGALRAGSITLLGTKVVSVLIAVAVTAALYLFVQRTHTGKSIRAVANNRAAAELMGINTSGVLALSFGIGTVLAMTAGGLIATLFPFTVLAGGVYELKSFVIVVLGGLGNPAGALAGGVTLGLLEGVTTVSLPVSWVPVIEYVVFVLLLLVRPAGLFARLGR
ncbi:MAG TPA: branched-chain amino acid ABC transporter permease [Chloroflexota bacterium]|nr:branched-chain amino acid ABC transporter permease [Chloroflexota bacterium]